MKVRAKVIKPVPQLATVTLTFIFTPKDHADLVD